MQIEGWLFYAPKSVSVAFLAEEQSSVTAELLPWDLLAVNRNMRRFIVDFNPLEETLQRAGCECYFVSSNFEKLDSWFDKTMEECRKGAILSNEC